MKKVDAEQLMRTMQRAKHAPVINVLDKDAFNSKHIPGSINIPFDDEDFVARVGDQVSSKGDPVIVYCASSDCSASERAAKKLEDAGFTQVHDFAAGVQGWEDAGYSLEGAQSSAIS